MPDEMDVPVSRTTAGRQLKEDVTSKIKTVTTSVRSTVIDRLVEEEIQRRATAVTSVYTKIAAAEKELQTAINAGTQGYNSAGGKVGEMTYTKQQAEEIKKVTETLARLNGALDKAFGDSPDFSKVLELGGK